MALGKREWDGFYSTDFDDILGLQNTPQPPPTDRAYAVATGALPPPNRKDNNANANDVGTLSLGEGGAQQPHDSDEEASDDRPFFSLVTGTYKSNPGVSRARTAIGVGDAGGEAQNGALVGIGDRSLVEWSSPAAQFLGQREYQGLEALVGQTEAKAATDGQSGIASDYGGV